MSKIRFYKYQGTGNDFIMIDDREFLFPYRHGVPFSGDLVSKLCHRRFGIGADGVILIRNHRSLDFEMVYFNPDGSQSLCGNGSRCAVLFAQSLGIIKNETNFQAVDGPHYAKIEDGLIHLKMSNVAQVEEMKDDLFIDTGSPHYIRFVKDLETFDVYQEGKQLRHDARFGPGGTNVNFVETLGANEIYVRTFERGVENETLSCGTGVTAASLAASLREYQSPVHIKTKGGSLWVSFSRQNAHSFEDIYLIGPAGMVFEGTIDI